MNSTKIFQNTWDLTQLPASLRLNSAEWRFLFCADGIVTAAQIQRRLLLTEPEREAILARLLSDNLLTEKALTLEEHARAQVDRPSASSEPISLSEYLQAAPSTAAGAASVPTPPPRPVTAAMPRPVEKSVPTFSPLPKPVTAAPHSRAMSLQSVIQFILNQSPDPTTGHLSTYQVFMGIDPHLLKRNGITSLRFQDDRLITDPELQAALESNLHKVLNVPCPEEVFSRAA